MTRTMRTAWLAACAAVFAVSAYGEPLSPVQLRERLNIAHTHVRRGEYARAAQVYRDLMVDHIMEDRVVRGYAGALRSMGRLDEALGAFTRGDARRDPPRFVRERVSILRQLGRNEDALDLCFEGLVKTPGLEQLLRNDILQLAEAPALGDVARERLAELFDDAPSPGVGETLVELYLEASRFEDAVETVERLDEVEPGRDGYRLFDLARRLGAMAQEKLALDVLDEMRARHPDVPRLREAALFSAELHVRLGRASDAYDNLTEYAEGMTRVDQRSYDVHMQRAMLLAGPLDRVDEALAIYDELLENHLLRPHHEAIRLQRAEVQLSLARYEGALIDFRDLAGGSRSESVRERAEFLIGEIFFYEGELDSAAAVWARQVESFPNGALANDALSRIFLFNENYGDDGASLREMGHVYRLETEGKVDAAASRAESMLARITTGETADDIEDDLLLKAGALWLDLGQSVKAMRCYDAIASDHAESRLAPVAMMAKAEILETLLAKVPEALAAYEELIVRYPLSIEASEVRPRVTRLRKEVRS